LTYFFFKHLIKMFSVFNKDFLKIIFIMKLDNVGTSVIVDSYISKVSAKT